MWWGRPFGMAFSPKSVLSFSKTKEMERAVGAAGSILIDRHYPAAFSSVMYF